MVRPAFNLAQLTVGERLDLIEELWEGREAKARPMTPRLTFRPVALREIREARRWCEQQHRGLGLRFLDDLDATVEEWREHPRINGAVTEDELARRALLR